MDILTRSPYYLTVTGSGQYNTKHVDVYLGDIEVQEIDAEEVIPGQYYSGSDMNDVATHYETNNVTIAQSTGSATFTNTADGGPGGGNCKIFQSGSLIGNQKYEVSITIQAEDDFFVRFVNTVSGTTLGQTSYTATPTDTFETKVFTLDLTGQPSQPVAIEVEFNGLTGSQTNIVNLSVLQLVGSTLFTYKEAPLLSYNFPSSSTGEYTLEIGTVLNDYVNSKYRTDGTQKFTIREYLTSESIQINDVSQSVYGYDGYGYYNEGINPSITDRVLLSTNRIYTLSGSDVIVPVKSDEGTTVGLTKDFNKIVSTTSTTSSIEYHTIESGSIESSNLLASPKDLTDSSWEEEFVTVTGGQTGPDGSTNAATVIKDPVNANDRIKQTVEVTPGDHTLVVYAKDAGMPDGGRATLGIRDASTLVREHRKTIQWDSGVPSFTTQYDFGTPTNAQIEDIGDGWYKISFTCNIVNSTVRWEYDVDRRFGTTNTEGVTLFEPMLLEGTDNFQTTYYSETEEIEGRKRYIVECQQQDPIKVTFVNKYGAFEDIYFTGNSKETLNVEREQLQNMTIHNRGRHVNRNRMVTGFRSMTINSGFYPEDYNEAFKQLLQSERVWMEYKGDTLPITVTDNTFNVKTQYKDKLINYTLQVERAFDQISKLK